MTKSTALPIAWVLLRILILLNWFFGACVLGLLAYTFVNEAWTMRALGVATMTEARTWAPTMRPLSSTMRRL